MSGNAFTFCSSLYIHYTSGKRYSTPRVTITDSLVGLVLLTIDNCSWKVAETVWLDVAPGEFVILGVKEKALSINQLSV